MPVERLDEILWESRRNWDHPSPTWKDLIEVAFFDGALHMNGKWHEGFQWSPLGALHPSYDALPGELDRAQNCQFCDSSE
ncbi:hypothetical protein [Streptomyces sp. NBC_00057]|uniref:hypothetical protein n=1 Tax=Streptomyces sp. NBC_00057 TaxID=2975634 RepID=UPI00324B3044